MMTLLIVLRLGHKLGYNRLIAAYSDLKTRVPQIDTI